MSCRRRALILTTLELAKFRISREQNQKPRSRFWVRKIISEERKEQREKEMQIINN